MNWISVASENRRRKILVLLSGMLCLLIAFPASAKNRNRFRSHSRFLKIQDICFYWRRRATRQIATEPGPAQQPDPSGRDT